MLPTSFVLLGAPDVLSPHRVSVRVTYSPVPIDPNQAILLQTKGRVEPNFTFRVLVNGEEHALIITDPLYQRIKVSFKQSFLYGKDHFALKFFYK